MPSLYSLLASPRFIYSADFDLLETFISSENIFKNTQKTQNKWKNCKRKLAIHLNSKILDTVHRHLNCGTLFECIHIMSNKCYKITSVRKNTDSKSVILFIHTKKRENVKTKKEKSIYNKKLRATRTLSLNWSCIYFCLYSGCRFLQCVSLYKLLE